MQFMKNGTLHAGIKRTPYKIMFGQPAKVGLTSSSLPRDVVEKINIEEDLESMLNQDNVENNT